MKELPVAQREEAVILSRKRRNEQFILKEEVLLMLDKIILLPRLRSICRHRSTMVVFVFFGFDVHFIFHVEDSACTKLCDLA